MEIDVAALDVASEHLWDHDFRLLHTHHFAATDAGQVEYLMRVYRPRGEVLDAGCGFGEVARLMVDMGSFANFTLLNISEYQLSKCPAYMDKYVGRGEAMPFRDGAFDAVMFNSSLLNMDRHAALNEAHRVVKPGGELHLSDVVIPVGVDYDAVAMAHEMHAHVSRAYDLITALYQHGFRIADFRLPQGTTDHMANLGEVVARLFTPLKPIVLRCIAVPKPEVLPTIRT